MNFGIALALLKAGKRVAREGWHLKGMHIYLVPEGRYPPTTRAGHLIAEQTPDGLVPYRPYIAFKGSDASVVPYACTQTDILAEDWRLAAGEGIDVDTIEEAVVELSTEVEVSGALEATLVVIEVGQSVPAQVQA